MAHPGSTFGNRNVYGRTHECRCRFYLDHVAEKGNVFRKISTRASVGSIQNDLCDDRPEIRPERARDTESDDLYIQSGRKIHSALGFIYFRVFLSFSPESLNQNENSKHTINQGFDSGADLFLHFSHLYYMPA